MTAALQAHEVTVTRGSRAILTDIALTADAGELVAVVGPNGAGKSTLVGALAGTLAPTTGSVWLYGTDITALSPVEQARRRAVLPQEHVVGFSFTCREVVNMGRFPWNRSPMNADDTAAVNEAMTECGVTDFADRPFSELSGGERARVALARIFAQRTGILLLDEPTAALDLHFQETAMRLVRSRVDDGRAALVVVHDLSLAASFSDRVIVLHNGSVVADGPPATTLTAGLLTEIYQVPVLATHIDGQPVILPRRDSGNA